MDTVTIDVKLVGLLATVAKCGGARLEVPRGTSMPLFMTQLAKYMGPTFEKFLVGKRGVLFPGVIIMIDGTVIPLRLLPAYRLEKDSILEIQPVVSGG